MFIDGSIHQLPDIDHAETARVARLARRGDRRQGQGPRALPARPAHGTGARQGRRRPGDGADRLHQHDPARAGAVVPRRRVHRAPHPRVHPLERGGDGRPREPPLRRSRRSPLDLRVGGRRCTRSASTTSSAARATAATATRCSSRVTPRPASTRARSSKAGSPRSSSTTSAARSAGSGLPSYPHPRRLPDVLGVPDGVDGARSAQRGVPGALQPLPLQPAARRHVERAGVVLRRRRRDGRARGDRRARARARASGSTT